VFFLLPNEEKCHRSRVQQETAGYKKSFWIWLEYSGAVSDVSRNPVRSSGEPSDDLPPARPLPFAADGTSFAVIIEVPSEREFLPAQNAIDLISRVHGDGRLPRIGFRVDPDSSDDELAAYVYNETTGKPLYFGLHPDMNYREFEAVHEVGHFLDHWGMGVQGAFSSLTGDPLLEGWRKAIAETQAVQNLEALQGLDYSMVGTRVRPVKHDLLSYYLNPKEIFARSYTQYIAISSGDTGLLHSLGKRIPSRARPMLYHEHWQSDDFEPVAKAFDTLFRGLGWLR
jgi:hypothetical protein